jgi:hypothetical protein
MSSALLKRANDLSAKQALRIFKGSKIKKSFTEGIFTGEVQKVEVSLSIFKFNYLNNNNRAYRAQ